MVEATPAIKLEKEKLSQKCKLSVALMDSLHITVGDFVLLTCDLSKFICKAYPLLLPCAATFVDDTVCISDCTEKKDASFGFLNSVVLLSTYTLLELTIDVVFTTVEALLRWKQQKDRLKRWCLNILTQYGVLSCCIVRCLEHPVAKLCDISSIVICDHFKGDVGKITRRTTIKIRKLASSEYYHLNDKKTLVLGGLGGPTSLLKEFITNRTLHKQYFQNIGLYPHKGILLVGPPGVGKTSLVNVVARNCEAFLLTISGPEICKPHSGESQESLQKIFNTAKLLCLEGFCILFIDELDSIGHKKYSTTKSNVGGLLSQLLTLIDGIEPASNLIVVGATNRGDVLNPALRRPGRFDKEINIGAPSLAERQEILQVLTASIPLSPDVDFAELAKKTPAFVGADLGLLCQEAAFHRFKLYKDCGSFAAEKIMLYQEDFMNVLKFIRPSIQRGSLWCSEVPPVQWNEIGGLEEVKKRIKICVEWPILYPEILSRMGLPQPHGVLLFGPPGCCKTTLLRAVATQCHINFFSVTSAQIYSPFVGDSEKAIVEVFKKARLAAPSIIFFDELDSIVGKRTFDNQSRGIQEKVLSVLLNEMDGIGLKIDEVETPYKVKVLDGHESSSACNQISEKRLNKNILVAGATNRPDMIDAALMRPGRFDVVLYVPPPDAKARHSILKVLTRKMPLHNVNLDWLAENTHLFSGADLVNLCREAALEALSQKGFDTTSIEQEYFCMALKKIKPSLDSEQLLMYQKIAEKYGHFLS